MKRQVVIGLEIHLQLKTESKLFCSCSADYIGATPNTNICPICLALPGSLPLLNDHAVDLAVRIGVGLRCKINDNTRFHRKHYFYADLPKAYQITQYEYPIAAGGYLDIIAAGKPKRVRINHLHMEEDAGKLVHPTADGRLTGAAYSFVDYNRGGISLSEIVSEPDMNTPAEAVAYVAQIRQLARYLRVSDGEMESGSLRVDVNVSLSNPDSSFGTRVEIKNINSLKSIERALEYEIARQNRILDEDGTLAQETRLWDDAAGVTRSMRSKEGVRDYRYYLEMDLAPIKAEPDYVEKIASTMPEMPWDKRERFIAEYGLSFDESVQLTEQSETADYYEGCVKAGASAARASNWIRMEVQRMLYEKSIDITAFPVAAEELGTLISKIDGKEISNTQARDALGAMVKDGLPFEDAMKKYCPSGGKLTGDQLRAAVQKIFAAEPQAVDMIKNGQDKKGAKAKYLHGLVMREARGSADPAEVAAVIKSLLE